jgi:hypothetical protein
MKKSLSELEYQSWLLIVKLERLENSEIDHVQKQRFYIAQKKATDRWYRRLSSLNTSFIDDLDVDNSSAPDSSYEYCPY